MGLREYFYSLADEICARLGAGEVMTCWLAAEDSDFVRLNRNRIRQAGNVRQYELTIDLIEGQRHAEGVCNISVDLDSDLCTISALCQQLREQRRQVAEDPYLNYATEVHDSEDAIADEPIAADKVLGDIREAADGLDLVGILASGVIYRGFANSFGQRNWYSKPSFVFDWSCYQRSDKAVKSRYAGMVWDARALQRKMDTVRQELSLIGRLPKSIAPGQFRVFLSPMALTEILEVVAWGGFSLRSHRTRQTPLLKLAEREKTLSAAITLVEDHANGLLPRFTQSGFLKPDSLRLIETGQYVESLVTPRSGKEYGVQVNSDSETPQSLDLAPGDMPVKDTLGILDTGIYINNLWYCNFSDYNDCRITGMTRFACFWVEKGKLKEPVNVMRFDESIYRLLGEELVSLTKERQFIVDPSSYHQRSLTSMHLPGVLIANFKFTL